MVKIMIGMIVSHSITTIHARGLRLSCHDPTTAPPALPLGIVDKSFRPLMSRPIAPNDLDDADGSAVKPFSNAWTRCDAVRPISGSSVLISAPG